ncbi:MAG: methyltransferase domain-containing protein [Chloroflexota bacterium]|nr:methyltransferase domain-containing protein [Chloroflexota bacterium]
MREARGGWIRSVAAPVTDWLIDALAVQPGETVLELAAGAGDAGFAIMDRAGPGVRLISSDVSPATIDVARRNAIARGLDNIEFRVLDAEHLDMASASVDVVICRWGYMLMNDPASALRETARVLRAGGRLAFSVWGDRARNRWTTIDAEVCRDLGYVPSSEPTGPGGMFSLADPDRLRTTVHESGFVVRRIERVPVSWPYASAEDYIAIEIDRPGPRGDFFRGLPHQERERAARLAADLLHSFRVDSGYLVPGETLNVLAVVV